MSCGKKMTRIYVLQHETLFALFLHASAAQATAQA